MATIYLSSTSIDLAEQRAAVYRILRRLHHDVRAMEDDVATDQRPLEQCLAAVTSCDLYIGIFAWRYGYVPPTRNPEGRECEYRQARVLGKPCLIFLVHEDAAWSRRWMDEVTGENQRGIRIQALRQELGRDHYASFFHTTDELAQLASIAISAWEMQQGASTRRDARDDLRRRYLEQVRRTYGSVRLPLGPATSALPAMFQPLTLRAVPLAAADLEREQRRTGPDSTPEEAQASRSAHLMGAAAREQESLAVGDIEAAIQHSPRQRLVILGGPGTGKTTTLMDLASRLARAI